MMDGIYSTDSTSAVYMARMFDHKKEDERKMITIKMNYLRRMLGVIRRDRMKNEEIMKKMTFTWTLCEKDARYGSDMYRRQQTASKDHLYEVEDVKARHGSTTLHKT